MEKRYQVPPEMLKFVNDAEYGNPHFGNKEALEAAIRWLAENPVVPTMEQANRLFKQFHDTKNNAVYELQASIVEWQLRMFLAPPRNPVVERVKDTLNGCTLTAGDAVELMDAIQRCTKPESK